MGTRSLPLSQSHSWVVMGLNAPSPTSSWVILEPSQLPGGKDPYQHEGKEAQTESSFGDIRVSPAGAVSVTSPFYAHDCCTGTGAEGRPELGKLRPRKREASRIHFGIRHGRSKHQEGPSWKSQRERPPPKPAPIHFLSFSFPDHRKEQTKGRPPLPSPQPGGSQPGAPNW